VTMRLAVITQSRARVGGVETYLERLIPALTAHYEVGFWSVTQETADRGAIALPAGVAVMSATRTAEPGGELRAWRPDLLFVHGLDDAGLERDVLRIAPAVFVAHTYHGTCITSAKTMAWPRTDACDRRFGAACLAMFYPRRCGGLNPITMARLYRMQTLRLANVKSAAAVVTLSGHMAEEMRRNGVEPDRVHVVRPFVVPTSERLQHPAPADGTCRLLFVGRLERPKGVSHLLSALRLIATRLDRHVTLAVAGEGAERPSLEAQAACIVTADPRIAIRFLGWQDDHERARLLEQVDALVVPSLWPEPFGLVGLEAAAMGVPAVAYATGGIPEWLTEGRNGCLASTEGDRARSLADAVVRCVENADTLARLRHGAYAAASQWTLDQHVRQLATVFRDALVAPMASTVAAAVPTSYA
jgi:glycosyltransferase involved in cell wall biosynthesis